MLRSPRSIVPLLPFLVYLCPAQDTAPQQETVPTFGTTVVIPSGLRGQIYKIKSGTRRLPNFGKLKPMGTIYTNALNVPVRDFTEGFPGVTARFEWFAIDYAGKVWIEKPGMYQFGLMSDDGSKLYINDVVVIDNDGSHSQQRLDESTELSGGVHRIGVSYFSCPAT